MKATDDGWKAEAMAHDSLVVDLLLCLKHSTKHQASRPWPRKLVAAPSGWGLRQPRSGSASGSKSVSECRRKSTERIGRRCSPSTPLSWSGGSGGGVDGCETSSRPANRSPSSRSKITLAGSEVNGASSSKPRKKKTYAELKVEEDMLLKERMNLNQELAMLAVAVKEHREENESLKRIKLNLNSQLMKNNPAAGTGGPKVASSKQAVTKAEKHDGVTAALIPARSSPLPTSCHAESDVIPGQKRSNLMLPDLNMMPSELESTN